MTTSPNPQVHNLKNDKAQNEADARKKIQMIVNHLDSGDDFATLAMNYSEDAETSGNGGDLGFAPESSLHNTDPGTRDALDAHKRDVRRLQRKNDIDWDAFFLRRAGLMKLNDEVRTVVAMQEVPVREEVDRGLLAREPGNGV